MATTAKPFLTFYTPTYKRPRLLENCRASVRQQSLDEWEQVIIPDEIGIGVGGMFGQVQHHVQLVRGDYVYLLQDDDVLADAHVVRDLKTTAKSYDYPAVVMVKNVKRGNVYPTPEAWGREPREGLIDLGSYVVRSDIFKRHASDFGQRYAGDFDFILALWQHNYRFFWYDRLIARAQALGLGRPESQLRVAI